MVILTFIIAIHHLDRVPDVSINIALGQRNAYTVDEENTYQVGYGHEFGLSCTTSSLFEVEWQLDNQPCKSSLTKACKILRYTVNSALTLLCM